MKQGDKNTEYFHRIATSHKRFSSIDTLMELVEGSSTNDSVAIKEAIQSFYQNHYKEIKAWRPELQLQGLHVLVLMNTKNYKNHWRRMRFREASNMCYGKAPWVRWLSHVFLSHFKGLRKRTSRVLSKCFMLTDIEICYCNIVAILPRYHMLLS